MLRTIIKDNLYKDSVTLMLLTNEIAEVEGVNKVSIMMGTPANKDIFENSGLKTEELAAATSNDMAIVIDTEEEEIVDLVLVKIDEFLASQAKSSGSKEQRAVKSWEGALKDMTDANLAVISVPGTYAASVGNRALDEGLHVFMFSDNVSLEDEMSLKEKAREKGLLCMGPDCGTGVIKGVPIAFTNNISPGKIGIVGASGTGIQEVTTIIDKLGGGVTNAIGTGGRDLSEEIGGITMLSSIATLAKDPDTEVITIISKPPAENVRKKIMNFLRTIDKPIVTIFLGEKPEEHEENLYHAYTLEEAAKISVRLLKGEEVGQFEGDSAKAENVEDGLTIKAYYSGGTLGGEAAMLIKDALHGDKEVKNEDGYMLKTDGFEVIDLGDDKYTQGKPHPMIDPTARREYMKNAMKDESTRVILFDIVLGYGSHDDMAGQLSKAIVDIQKDAQEQGREIHFVTSICGTDKDPQDYDSQKKIMEDIGVIVCDTNNKAVEKALALIGKEIEYPKKDLVPRREVTEDIYVESSDSMKELITDKPKIINIGLESFYDTFKTFGVDVVQYDWKPIAGGNPELVKALDFLRGYKFK
nr:acyl-CoA synthetase FdrA [Tissierella sp.]